MTSRLLMGILALTWSAEPPAASAATEVRSIQKLSVVHAGSGFQVMFYNYSRGTFGVSNYHWGNSALPYFLSPGEVVGGFLYDHWFGRFTEGVYVTKEGGL